MKNDGFSEITAIVVAVAIIAIGYAIYHNNNMNDCKSNADKAAIETYPISQYPDTAQRSSLQEAYKQKYLQSCN